MTYVLRENKGADVLVLGSAEMGSDHVRSKGE
jgi:hypothetical protein